MRCLIDAQLPPGLCAWLREQQIEAVHVFDVLGGQTPDSAIVAYAVANDLVLITKDDDFRLRHPAQRLSARLAALREHHQPRTSHMDGWPLA